MLRRLHPDGKRLVSAALVSGETPRHPPRAYEGLLEDMERVVDHSALDRVLDDIIGGSTRWDPAIDPHAAPLLHEALPLSRREAADPGVWRFLAVIHRPDFIRHRWENRSLTVMRDRFWAPGTRPDSNTFSRLWWVAELTKRDGSYDLTRRALARQALATNIFVRSLSSHRPIVEACVDVLEEEPSPVIEECLRRLNQALSTLLLEGQSLEELSQLVTRLRDEARPATVRD